MKHKIRYALIGCGRISANHIMAASNNGENLDIVAVCDPVKERTTKVLAHLSKEQREHVSQFEDYREMLATCKPELVAIATESGKHAAIGLDCMNEGCHVIIEKPIALSIEDAQLLVDTAKRNQVKLCACHQNRFNKSIQKVREAYETNLFGRMLHGTAHIRWRRDEDYYLQAPWRGTWEQDGGALMNQCIHNIDLLRWMMGDDVEEVFAYTDRLNHPYIEAEDLGIALIRFTSGAYGVIEGTTNVYPRNLEELLYLFGENATVKVGGKSANIIEEWVFRNGEGADVVKREYSENPPNIYGFGHTPLYADMIDAILQNRAPYVDGEAGMRALELVLAIYESAATGKAVHFPLVRGSTMDYKGRF